MLEPFTGTSDEHGQACGRLARICYAVSNDADRDILNAIEDVIKPSCDVVNVLGIDRRDEGRYDAWVYLSNNLIGLVLEIGDLLR